MALGDIPFKIQLWGLNENPQPPENKYDDIIDYDLLGEGMIFDILGLQQYSQALNRPDDMNNHLFNSSIGRDVFLLDFLHFDSNNR